MVNRNGMCINIGNKIRKYRLSKGYSQDYMALNLEISQKTYSRLECNQSKCDLRMLMKIARLLEVDPASFLEGSRLEKLDAMEEEIKILRRLIGIMMESR